MIAQGIRATLSSVAVAASLLAAGCSSAQTTPANPVPQSAQYSPPVNPVLNWTCHPYVPANGQDIQDLITVTNPGNTSVMLSQWTVTYTNSSGDVIGTDSGEAPGNNSNVDALLIQPGETRPVSTYTSTTGLDSLITIQNNTDMVNGTYIVTFTDSTTATACSVTSWQEPSNG